MRLLALTGILALFACGSSGPGYRVSTLSSGKQVKVINVTKMFFSKGDTALILDYQTDIPFTDKAALNKEVDDIWSAFKNDVEKANVKSGVIRANEAPKGTFIQTKNQFGFVFTRAEDGSWSRK
ncbi:MAG: hypothetical protein H6P99_1171 [Holophagaceae bacterium]|nr:hypothetical protein [Holophagaceae bacterium]